MRDLRGSFKQRVPLWFNVGDESNNMKIWDAIQPELDLLFAVFSDIEELIDIDQSEDLSVDLHGKNMGESRQGQDDLTYIKRIKGKYSKLKAKSDHNSIVGIISEVLDVGIEKIRLYSLENRHLRVEITISSLTNEQAKNAVMSAKAAGIIIDEIVITEEDNVFRFSPSSEIIYNSSNGFDIGKISSIL